MSSQNHIDILLQLFSLSISAHNVQPFRLNIVADNSYEIWSDVKRLLSIADPHNRDLQIGLGALLETLEIGLSSSKLTISNLKIKDPSTYSHDTNFLLASFNLEKNDSITTDTLNVELSKRFSYRGKFKIKKEIQSGKHINKSIELKFICTPKEMSLVAVIFDQVNLHFLSIPGYIDELFSWMRFNKSQKNYFKDGLNSESMALNSIDTLGASIVLRPRIFNFLKKINIISFLISEKPIIESSSAIVAIVGKSDSPIEIGRGFMRGWLMLTSMGLYGAPLSLLTDDLDALQKMKLQFKLNDNENIYNILRVGPLAPEYKIPNRARLNKEEYYV